MVAEKPSLLMKTIKRPVGTIPEVSECLEKGKNSETALHSSYIPRTGYFKRLMPFTYIHPYLV